MFKPLRWIHLDSLIEPNAPSRIHVSSANLSSLQTFYKVSLQGTGPEKRVGIRDSCSPSGCQQREPMARAACIFVGPSAKGRGEAPCLKGKKNVSFNVLGQIFFICLSQFVMVFFICH